MKPAALLLASYLAGSIPFGFLIARFRGVDLRKIGSGNIGATNAMRALGKPLGILVFVLDAGKGFLPAWLALPLGTGWALAAGTAAVLGHNFPVWLRFRGGKGVATGCGVWLALSPLACLGALLTFALALAVTRYVSLASILGACAVPLSLAALRRDPEWLVMAAAGMAALIALRHRANLVRIAAGVEPRIGNSPP